MIERASHFLLKEFPAHPFDTDEESIFVVGPKVPGEGQIIAECYEPERVYRVYGLDDLRLRRHEMENQGRTQ